MKRVYFARSVAEVSLMKGLLEQYGIKCLLRNEWLSTLAGEVPFTECSPELWVRNDEDFYRAQDLLASFRSQPPPGPAWVCPGCGEKIDGHFAICWNCGKPCPS